MRLRIIVLLGLLGLILITLALVIWSIETFTEWLFQTGTISQLLSFFPHLITSIATAAVQAVLLYWIPSSLLWTIKHIKMERVTFSHVPNIATTRLELSFEGIVFIHQDITTNIRTVTIALDISSNVLPWISISIVDPYVCKSISNTKAANPISYTCPASESKPFEPTFLSGLLNYDNGGLLQLLLRHVKFCATNGTMRVVDRTKSFEFYVDAQFEEFGLSKHRSICEELTYTDEYKLLYLKKFNAKIFVKSDASATLHCSYFSLHIANAAGKRDQPYSSGAMNMLLGRQHWIFDVWIQLAGFYLGTYELNQNVHPRGEILFARQIEIKVTSFNNTGKLQLKVELPICLEYSPELARFVEWMLRCMVHYRPPGPKNNTAAAALPIPTKEKTFPAALDMDIKVSLGMVSCLLWNEHDSCLLMNWKKLAMRKADGETKMYIHNLALQLGDYREFVKAEQGNEKLMVEQIVITHGDDNPYIQDLFIDLIKPIVTWNADVHKHIKQMMEEVQILTAKLHPLMPPPQPSKSVHGSVTWHDVRILIPLPSIAPTVEIASSKLTMRSAEKQSVSLWDTVISAGILTIAKHKFLCIESEDTETRGGYIMTTYDRDPFEINKTSLYNVVFNGFVPMYEWLKKWW